MTAWLPVLILFAPLAVAALLLFASRHLRRGGDWFATMVMAGCFLGSLVLAGQVLAHPEAAKGLAGPSATWMAVGDSAGVATAEPRRLAVSATPFALVFGIHLDPMGAIMLCLVTGLAVAVMVYTTWYLHDDANYRRFWWMFCFFCFAMEGVVLSANLLQTFVCWELVGLGSYLLIGFWQQRPPVAEDPRYQAMKAGHADGIIEAKLSPADAQLKAFVMNRIGDAGFIAGIALCAWVVLAFHARHGQAAGDLLNWQHLFDVVAAGGFDQVRLLGLSGNGLLTVAGVCLFLGAVGKSAQFPLHTWLPDAMQGPTTASAIIHAATMVAAGVFLVARIYPLLSPEALAVVMLTGATTCLLAATMACVQWDLKGVLAYSTVSQLGFMLVGLGAGAAAGGYAAGVGHLFTHAVFKCLLFLGAAAVIHACHHHQDLGKLGGLARRMPVTAAAMAVAVLTICGLPGSGAFWSKDAILGAAGSAAAAHHGWLAVAARAAFWMSVATAVLTAFYMGRWWLRLFVARPVRTDLVAEAHDPPWPQRLVLIALAAGCLQWWWTGSPIGPAQGWLDRLLVPPAAGLLMLPVESHPHHLPLAIPLGAASLGLGLAVLVYWALPALGLPLAERLRRLPPISWLWGLLARLWFIEGAYDLLVRLLGKGLGRLLAVFDLGTGRRLERIGRPDQPMQAPVLDQAFDDLARGGLLLGRLGNRGFHAGRVGGYVAWAALASGLLILWLG